MARILLIDDTDQVRALFRTILQQAGHAVGEACNGAQGIRLFRDTPADVVITDLYMPDGDGFEVITTLRRELPAPKIIAISGQSGTGDMLDAAKLLGADLILPKPVSMDGLLTAVETVLRMARLGEVAPRPSKAIHGVGRGSETRC